MTSEHPESWSDLPQPLHFPVPDLLENYQTINILAPLVRCSKLPFRHLVSLYETHVTHTPMMLAQEFSRSQIARISDFSTSKEERGVFWVEPRVGGKGKSVNGDKHPDDSPPSGSLDRLNLGNDGDNSEEDKKDSSSITKPSYPFGNNYITYHSSTPSSRLPPTLTPPTTSSTLIKGCVIAQFASPSSKPLADAAELISPYVDGIDLNCGCPQGWAYSEGIGCALLRKPEVVRDMVRAVHNRLGWNWPVSVKIRIDPEVKRTEELVRNAVMAGASHITIHGRTRHQASTEPVNLPGIEFAVECAKEEVPCVANGDLWDLEDARKMRETGVKGVMAARGLLANPALFAGYKKTPKHAVEQFINLSTDYGLIFPLFHRHLSYMLESQFQRAERVYFNTLPSSVAVVDHLITRGIDLPSMRQQPIWDATRGRTAIAV